MTAGGKTAILVVDDEVSDLEKVRRILASEGNFAIRTAFDYREALEVFDDCSEEIDLALLDVALPGRNGVDLARHLLTLKPNLRVVFISGHAGASLMRMYGFDASNGHFLQKPFDAATLMRCVSKALASNERPALGDFAAGAGRSPE